MDARRPARTIIEGLLSRGQQSDSSGANGRGNGSLGPEQARIEARIHQAKEDVRRAMALFNEHLSGLAQTIIALQAELSRARQGAWITARAMGDLEERLRAAEAAYAEVERQRQELVLAPLRQVEQAELRLIDARRKSDVALAANEAGQALAQLRESLGEALILAEARNELGEVLGQLPPAEG